MYSLNTDITEKLIVFTRYPVPGNTKTRLIPSIGPTGAADLQRKLTEKIIDTAKEFSSSEKVDLDICFSGGTIRQMKSWLGENMMFSRQAEGDLGERMYAAFKSAFSSGKRSAVLIGTDIPCPVTDHLREAFRALVESDVVLGPSMDGGYWLIGMKEPHDLFKGVEWGKNTVLNETAGLARSKGLSVFKLSPLNDIDTADDLMEWNPEGNWQNPYISVIIPALNEEEKIGRTIDRVKNSDAEIIVVDGGSTDNTVQISESLGAKVIKSSRGRALQQNTGAMKSRGNNLLFLHADTLLPLNYTELIFEALMDKSSEAGAFRFKTDLNIKAMRLIEFYTNLRSCYFQLPYGDQGIFLPRDIFFKAGCFPDKPVAEDIFLVRNIKKFTRIKTVPADAVTSARRWRKTGVLKTTLIHIIIMLGCYIGVDPEKLTRIHQMSIDK